MELEHSSPKTDRSRAFLDSKVSSNHGRLVKNVRTLTRVFKTKVETIQQHILQAEELENRYNEEVKLRKEAEEALAKEKEELDVMKRLLESYKEEQNKLNLQAKALEKKHENELRLRKDLEIVLAIELEKIDKLKIQLTTLVNEHNVMIEKAEEFESKYKDEILTEEKERLNSQARALEKRYENEFRLRKDIEIVLSIEQEKIEKLKIRLTTLENEHNVMIEKAKEFASKYMDELILKKALIKENQELVEAYYRDVDLDSDAYALREERDYALNLVDEITAKQMEESKPPTSFICPISQEVMKDPHFTADGYTYEAEAIRTWFRRGHDTSPMTNLKLSHRELVPNLALRSAIQELVFDPV